MNAVALAFRLDARWNEAPDQARHAAPPAAAPREHREHG